MATNRDSKLVNLPLSNNYLFYWAPLLNVPLFGQVDYGLSAYTISDINNVFDVSKRTSNEVDEIKKDADRNEWQIGNVQKKYLIHGGQEIEGDEESKKVIFTHLEVDRTITEMKQVCGEEEVRVSEDMLKAILAYANSSKGVVYQGGTLQFFSNMVSNLFLQPLTGNSRIRTKSIRISNAVLNEEKEEQEAVEITIKGTVGQSLATNNEDLTSVTYTYTLQQKNGIYSIIPGNNDKFLVSESHWLAILEGGKAKLAETEFSDEDLFALTPLLFDPDFAKQFFVKFYNSNPTEELKEKVTKNYMLCYTGRNKDLATISGIIGTIENADLDLLHTVPKLIDANTLQKFTARFITLSDEKQQDKLAFIRFYYEARPQVLEKIIVKLYEKPLSKKLLHAVGWGLLFAGALAATVFGFGIGFGLGMYIASSAIIGAGAASGFFANPYTKGIAFGLAVAGTVALSLVSFGLAPLIIAGIASGAFLVSAMVAKYSMSAIDRKPPPPPAAPAELSSSSSVAEEKQGRSRSTTSTIFSRNPTLSPTDFGGKEFENELSSSSQTSTARSTSSSEKSLLLPTEKPSPSSSPRRSSHHG